MKKKAKRIKIRRSWVINPKTRVKPNKKRFSRKKKKEETRNDIEIWSS